jgi:hypothetical protein
MYNYTSLALTWILFLALFPVSFFWGRRAYRIFIKRDYSEVALKRGESPKNPKKWAPFVGLINIAGSLMAAYTIFGILVFHFSYDKWSAMAGITIWGKIFADWIIRQQAHPMVFGRKKKVAATN